MKNAAVAGLMIIMIKITTIIIVIIIRTRAEYSEMTSPSRAAASVADSVGYKFFVPPLPVAGSSSETVYLHCDLEGRPYDAHDFVEEFKRLSIFGSLRGCVAIQRNHLWNVWFCNSASLERLLEAKELTVKGGRCLVLDVRSREVHVKIHWVPLEVRDRAVKKMLKHYCCSVQGIERAALASEPPEQPKWTTVSAKVTLKDGLTVEDVPHHFKFQVGTVSLVTIVGRLPLCLRCKEKGHLRKQCTAPRCAVCARVGHAGSSCPRKTTWSEEGKEGPAAAADGNNALPEASTDDKPAKPMCASRKNKKFKEESKK